MSIVAGVDSSTQSCTVALYDADSGALLGAGSAPHPSTGSPPSSEQHPEDWWSAFGEALRRSCGRAGVAVSAIDAVSITAQYHGLVALDDRDRVIRPAKLWNDTTSAPQSARLIAAREPGWWPKNIGSTPTAAFTVTKLAWMLENEPDAFRRVRSILVPHDWLTFRLTGEKTTDRVDASGTGYFDAARETWRTDILSMLEERDDWESHLPRVLGPAEPAGCCTTRAAGELGLRSDVVVGPGTGDQAAVALALGVGDGRVAVSLGTSGTVIAASDEAMYDIENDLNVTANAAGGFQPIAVLLNATRVTDTFARLLGVDHDAMAGLALAADADRTDRPVLLAYLDGERTPDRPYARGILAGLTSDMTREGLAYSAFEGVAFGLRAGLDAVRQLGVAQTGPIVLTGGGSASKAYRQIIADVFGAPVAELEGDSRLDAARGAGIQAAACLRRTGIRDARSAWGQKLRVTDRPRAADSGAQFERYLAVRAATELDGLLTSTKEQE